MQFIIPQVAATLLLAVAAVSSAQSSSPQSAPTASKPSATQPAAPSSTESIHKKDDNRNPPSPGFNLEGSDFQAIELADLTMQAMGGREAWDSTRYITWNFFGNRRHVWDKLTGNTRLEFGDKTTGAMNVILMNINTKQGRAWMAGEEVKDPKQLEQLMRTGYGAWVNDGYWMFMPYKLKDSGVTLKYKGPGKMNDGRDAEVITLTFKDTGLTPQNKYEVFIGATDHLVGQWNYYKSSDAEEPSMVSPWKNWKRFGRILLSDERGKGDSEPLRHTDIAVFDELPESILTSSDAVDWAPLMNQAK